MYRSTDLHLMSHSSPTQGWTSSVPFTSKGVVALRKAKFTDASSSAELSTLKMLDLWSEKLSSKPFSFHPSPAKSGVTMVPLSPVVKGKLEMPSKTWTTTPLRDPCITLIYTIPVPGQLWDPAPVIPSF